MVNLGELKNNATRDQMVSEKRLFKELGFQPRSPMHIVSHQRKCWERSVRSDRTRSYTISTDHLDDGISMISLARLAVLLALQLS